nr:MAG: hypothetical protein [brine shrimp arlivirus 7]
MFNIEDNLTSKNGNTPIFPRYTLDNPILPHNRNFFMKCFLTNSTDAPSHIIKEVQFFKDTAAKLTDSVSLSRHSEKKYHELFSPTLLTSYPEDKCLINNGPILNCVMDFLHSLRKTDMFPNWAKVDGEEIVQVREVIQNKELQNLIYWNDQISNLRNQMATMQSQRQKSAMTLDLDHPLGIRRVIYTGNFVVIFEKGEVSSETAYLFDYDQICGIVDTSIGRTLTIESAMLHDAFNIQTMPKNNIIEKLYLWGDKQLQELGNNGYKVLKTYESIVRTLSLRNEPYDYCRSFHRNCLNGLKDVLQDLGLTDVSYTELKDILDQTSDIQSSEIAGLYRHWMHPTVNEEEGMRKIKNISKAKKNISDRLIMRIRAAFNRSFVQEYITQNRRWPPAKMSQHVEGPLPGWVSRKSLIFDESAEGYSWEHWAYVSFGKIFEFDYKLDILELLDDKACSLPKDQCNQIYYKKYSSEDWCKDREQRRVLINLLTKEEFNTKQIIETIINREIPDNWKTVGLHSKEREMKMEPRLFAILPPEIRAYFILTEHNIAKYLFKYFPQQTMNLDADQLDRRLLQMASDKNPSDSKKKKFTANLDFKSWNIHWTREAVEAIFLQIGCMFGMPTLFTYTHEFFETAMLYLSSFCCPPEKWRGGSFKTSDQCDCHLWFGHYGGLEGLRQKGWTLVTIAMLELVRLETEIESIITGQGDNQVVIFFIKELLTIGLTLLQIEQYYTNKIKEYIKKIEEISSGMGQVLKTDETWVSSRIIEYGKDLLIDGVFVSSVYKKVSRALEVTNELAPGLQSQISHVFSVMQASCAKGFSWLPIYIQSLTITERVFKSYLKFDQSNPTRGIKTLTSSMYNYLLQMVLFIPRSIGGLAALPFPEFILRGHPDPVTSGLMQMKLLEDKVESIPPYMTALIAGTFFAEETDYLMLATAPDSLNLDNVRTEQNIWKALVKNGAKNFVKNTMFKEIIMLATNEGERELIDWMKETRPIFPRFLSIVYSATIFGAMAKVIGRFGNNKTLVYAAGARDVKSSLSAIRRSHDMQWENLMKNYQILKKTNSTFLKDKCCTSIAQKLRDLSWQVQDIPDGIYGSTVPHPFEQVKIYENVGGNCSPTVDCHESPYVFFQVQNSPTEGPRHLHRGFAEPYLSGRIRPKREQGIIHTTVLDSPIISAAQLASNRISVCDPGTPMDETIVNIIKSRTNIPIEIVESLIGKVYGGTLWHRLPDQYTSHEISLNCRPNISTHLYISTDTMKKYSRGMRDYTLPYQSIFIAINSLLSDASARGKLPAEKFILHAHLSCEECTREIEPIKISCSEKYGETIPSTTNPLIKSTTKTLPLSVRDLTQPPLQFVDKSDQTDNHRVTAISYLIMHRFHTNIQVAMRGITPCRRYKTDLNLRMGDVLSAGPAAIIKKVTDYMLTSFPNFLTNDQYQTKNQLCQSLVLFVNMSGHHIWQNIGTFATLPEFVNSLYENWSDEDPGMDYGKGGHHTYRFLNRLLIKSIHSAMKTLRIYKRIKTLRLYSSDPNWTNLLYTSQHVIITTWLYTLQDAHPEIVSQLISMDHTPYEESIAERVRLCLQTEHLYDVLHILQTFSPKIRNETPESDARCRDTNYVMTAVERIKHLSATIPHQIPHELKLNIIYCSFSNFVTNAPPISPNPRVEEKARKDHEFKLAGNSSTAIYKWICALKHLELQGEIVMTLGEGAGGLARGLLEIFHCDSIVFNTLIDSKEFDPHRVTSYLPSELRDWADRIHELKYCCEHGGDLLIEKTVQQYGKWKNVSLVTCDAEVNIDNYKTRMQLVDNVTRISYGCLKSTGHVVIKSFIQNVHDLVNELQLISRAFRQVKIFYTKESSYENYEIFIEAWEKRSDFSVRYLSLNTISEIYSLSCSRIKDVPIQLSFPEEHASIERLMSYKPPNLNYALSVFSNSLLQPDQWNEVNINLIQIEINFTAIRRVRTHKNLIRSQTSHVGEAAIVGAVVSEEKFLDTLSVWYINLEILKGLILLKNESVWDYRFRNYHPSSVYFIIRSSEMHEYEQRYARHFYHLLGHAKRL